MRQSCSATLPSCPCGCHNWNASETPKLKEMASPPPGGSCWWKGPYYRLKCKNVIAIPWKSKKQTLLGFWSNSQSHSCEAIAKNYAWFIWLVNLLFEEWTYCCWANDLKCHRVQFPRIYFAFMIWLGDSCHLSSWLPLPSSNTLFR